jgi:hypothetical protein
VNIYRDKVFNTLVFDVDSTESYSSWPFETAYSQKAVDWKITPSDTAKYGKTGDQFAFKIAIANVTPAIIGVPAGLTFTGQMVNYPGQSTVQPTELTIARTHVDTMLVNLSSSDTGMFGGLLRVSIANPGGGDPAIQDFPLKVFFSTTGQGLSMQCDSPAYRNKIALDPMTDTFAIVLKNVGANSEEIEAGVTSGSQGLTYQIGSFSNPVASGDSRTISLVLTGTGKKFPYTATFWSQIKGAAATYKQLVLSLDTGSTAAAKPRRAVAPRELSIWRFGGSAITLWVPGAVPAVVRVFDLSGRQVLRCDNVLGDYRISGKDLSREGAVIVQVRQGMKVATRKMVIYR